MEHTDDPGVGADAPVVGKVSASELTTSEVMARFSQLATDLRDADGVEETVQAVVEFALQALGCGFAGVALQSPDGIIEIPAVTDPVLADIYQFQLDGHEGPLMVSMRDHVTVLVRDTNTETRWPEWASKVHSLGVRSVLAVPLLLGGDSPTVGMLGVYSLTPDGFDADDEAIAHILARRASVAVAVARQEEALAAVDARELVGQATGILMERYGLDSDRAFELLKRHCQETNTKLRDVSQELVDSGRLSR
jgi:GAF domain-containing protein